MLKFKTFILLIGFSLILINCASLKPFEGVIQVPENGGIVYFYSDIETSMTSLYIVTDENLYTQLLSNGFIYMKTALERYSTSTLPNTKQYTAYLVPSGIQKFYLFYNFSENLLIATREWWGGDEAEVDVSPGSTTYLKVTLRKLLTKNPEFTIIEEPEDAALPYLSECKAFEQKAMIDLIKSPDYVE